MATPERAFQGIISGTFLREHLWPQPEDVRKSTWRITTKEEEHIIYAHWFLNTNPATLYQAPSKNMMLHLIELAGLYCTDKNDDEYDLQQEAIEAADFPNSRYSITSSHPKSKWTKDGFKAGNRKHLEGTNGLNTRRLKIWKDQIFPAIKKSLDQITQGGVNAKAASISTKTADQMTSEIRWDQWKGIDPETIKYTVREIESFEVENAPGDGERNGPGIVFGLRELKDSVAKMAELAKMEERAQKSHQLLSEIVDLEAKMFKMTHKEDLAPYPSQQ
ncbi:hypothetical protein B0J14DRAFT_568274 [Halenospora varia]|nr:hypothetical protein B0J14DRAFT_568274 [Halenospora varia]